MVPNSLPSAARSGILASIAGLIGTLGAAVPAQAQGPGACCLPSGACQVTAQFNCVTLLCGIYRGDGTTCPNNCTPQPLGACCSTVNGGCYGLMTQCDCSFISDGQFAGVGTTCGACGPVNGACCLPNHNCARVPQAYCLSNGGVYRGDGTSCGVTTCPACYPNCDESTSAPILNVNDFVCFLNSFAAADAYANCDRSTGTPILNVLDFTCFLNAFAAGCS